MALLGAESWDFLGNSDHVEDYWVQDSASTSLITAGAGRCGSPAYCANVVEGGPRIGVDTTASGGYAGVAYNPATHGASILSIADAIALRHLFFRCTADGGIQVWRGANPTLGELLGSTSPNLLNLGHYSHLGFQWVIHPSAGSFTVWVDAVAVLTRSGINTNGTGPFQSPGQWRLLEFNPKGCIDDLYWGDSSGAAPWNAFLGDLRVEGQVALTDAAGGGGTYREFDVFDGLGGTDHGAVMDDIPPNDDVDYTHTTVAGERETVKFPNITLGSGLVLGVQVMPNMIKTLSGDRQMAVLIRSGGADAQGVSKGIPQTHYKYLAQMFQVNPVSGVAWTAATTNAMEGGLIITV